MPAAETLPPPAAEVPAAEASPAVELAPADAPADGSAVSRRAESALVDVTFEPMTPGANTLPSVLHATTRSALRGRNGVLTRGLSHDSQQGGSTEQGSESHQLQHPLLELVSTYPPLAAAGKGAEEGGTAAAAWAECDAVVRVDVQRAMGEGVRFRQRMADGAVLTSGNASGIVPASCFSVVIELCDGLGSSHPAKAARLQLLESLFPSCSRVVARRLHGAVHARGAALVLLVDTADSDGHPNEPTLVRVDDGRAMIDDLERAQASPESTTRDHLMRVLRGPKCASHVP